MSDSAWKMTCLALSLLVLAQLVLVRLILTQLMRARRELAKLLACVLACVLASWQLLSWKSADRSQTWDGAAITPRYRWVA